MINVCVFILIILATGFGCDSSNHYLIEIKPQDISIKRKLICWRSKQGDIVEFPKKQLKLIANVYGHAIPPPSNQKYSFVGDFILNIPNDIGGSGVYTHFKSPMGSLKVYSERSQGEYDMEKIIKFRIKAVNKLINFLVHWLELEKSKKYNSQKLIKFVDNDLRQDVKNISLMAWVGSQKLQKENHIAQIWQYLIEKKYCTTSEWPLIFRASNSEDFSLLFKLIRSIIIRKTGIKKTNLPNFFSNLTSLRKSWIKSLHSTKEYQSWMQKWHDKEKDPLLAKLLTDELVFYEIFLKDLTGTGLFNETNQIEIRLYCDNKPFGMNGQWDKNKKQVVWQVEIKSELAAPNHYFAFWSTPNVKAQTKYFGKTILKEEKLADYVLWYNGLTSQESKEWDSYVSKLTLKNIQLENFRFSKTKEQSQNKILKKLADVPKKIITETLKNKSK